MTATSIPVRLLSSVAVIGRDNEPIFLRGELYKARKSQDSQDDAGGGAASVVEPEHEEDAAAVGGDDTVAGEASQASSSGASSATKRSTSLFGRIKDAVTPNTSEVISSSGQSSATDKAGGGDDGEDDGDPFGFFSSNNTTCASLASSASAGPAVQMSLTQQLVLHASLDRFEERMAGGRGSGAAPRWRTPGSSGTNGMWMGLLCRVEERWNVYGYLTNTGVKFMIVVEELYMTRDGKAVSATPSTLGLSGGSAAPTNHREGDLRNIFGHLHELVGRDLVLLRPPSLSTSLTGFDFFLQYVRYSLNPFSQLRGAIRSESFEKGIVDMAVSFNDLAIEDANGSGLTWM